MTSPKLIVLVAIDGRQSSSVADALLEFPDQWIIRGTYETVSTFRLHDLKEKCIDIVKCNLNDRKECLHAFHGAYGIFCINKYWETLDEKKYLQMVNIIEAARAAKVTHFITSGIPDTKYVPKNLTDSSWRKEETLMEQYIRQLTIDSSFPHITFIRTGFYYQNFITFFASYTSDVEFRYPSGLDARIPVYDVRDTGKIVLECLRHPDKWGTGQVIPMVAEQLSLLDICSKITEVKGKDVKFVPLSFEEAKSKLHREIVNNLRWHNEIASRNDRLAETTQEICSQLRTFSDWLRETQWLID